MLSPLQCPAHLVVELGSVEHDIGQLCHLPQGAEEVRGSVIAGSKGECPDSGYGTASARARRLAGGDGLTRGAEVGADFGHAPGGEAEQRDGPRQYGCAVQLVSGGEQLAAVHFLPV